MNRNDNSFFLKFEFPQNFTFILAHKAIKLLFIENMPSILIGWKHTHNSPYPATDDQIWKNFAFNNQWHLDYK